MAGKHKAAPKGTAGSRGPSGATSAAGLAPPVPQVNRETLRTRVYDSLASALIMGRFEPGQALTVRGLAEAFGVSPTPVREALQRLAAAGALSAEPNRFYRVPTITLEKIQDLRRVRAALEGLAAEEAAKLIVRSELQRLERANASMLRAIERQDRKAYLVANERFHFTIYKAAQSETLLQIIHGLWLRVGPALNLLFRDIELVQALDDNHQAALTALAARDGAGARAAIVADIMEAGAFLADLAEDEEGQTSTGSS
ncbi:MAG: GntR family transcriptional regulator [Pseudomonadota bacterium]